MSLRLLILGGTGFLGAELTRQARERGWTITLFNRGSTNRGLFPEIEQRQGDRVAGNLASLESGNWDACIDTCGYVPRVVRQSCDLLAGRIDHYQFVSSISVYADPSQPGMDEEAAVGLLDDPDIETIDGTTYGPLKALCEDVTRRAFGDRALIVRPGLIVGPTDRSDRFTYWPVRLAEGGDVLIPDALDQPVQVIDVRDLSEFMLDLAERRSTGVFNATGPETPLSFAQVLEACPNGGSRLYAVPPEYLDEQSVNPWTDLPLWLPEDGWGMSSIDVRRAVAAGLRFRPLSETAEATLAWWKGLDPPREPRTGLARSREREVLEEAQRRGIARLVAENVAKMKG